MSINAIWLKGNVLIEVIQLLKKCSSFMKIILLIKVQKLHLLEQQNQVNLT